MYVDCEVGLNCDNCENLLVLETLFRCCIYIYIYLFLLIYQADDSPFNRIKLYVIVPTFDTKVTEYLCSGWVFFLQTNFDFLTSHF